MELHLSAPPPDLEDFPALVLPAGTELWTVHAAGDSPLVCSGAGDGRFDLATPEGTCYFATEPLGALLECCFRDTPEVDEQALRERRLSVVRTERALRLADLADMRAFGFGVTAEVHSIPDYELTQQWARAARAAGFDGVHYLLRHDPSRSMAGVARFGPAGERQDWGTPHTRAFDEELLREAAERLGVRVRTP